MQPTEADLQAALPDGYALCRYEEIDSTNSEAQRWLEAGRAPKAFFIADVQTAGRGRRGREWQSPNGNLYASLLVPAPETAQAAGRYGFIISLAIHHAIAALLPSQAVTLKWPNDVLVGGAKISGVLLELEGEGLIIGFGVNIGSAPTDTPYKATSLADKGVSVTSLELAADILKAFWLYEAMALPELIDAWRRHAQGIGEAITVKLPNTELLGIFKGLKDDGSLHLYLPDGTDRMIYSGEVFFTHA